MLLPVNSSEPAITTSINPTGNTAPKSNFTIPGGAPAAARPPVTTSAKRPPNAIYAPAKKLKINKLLNGDFSFNAAIPTQALAVSAGDLKDDAITFDLLLFIFMAMNTHETIFLR